MAYLFSLYTWELNFGQTIWGIEVRCYWERPKEQPGTLRNAMRTPWEHIGSEGEKNPARPPPPKEKNWTPHESSRWLHETFLSKTACHHFWSGLVAGAQIVGHSTTMVHKSIPLKRSLIFHFLHKMPIHMVDTPLKTLALFLPLLPHLLLKELHPMTFVVVNFCHSV